MKIKECAEMPAEARLSAGYRDGLERMKDFAKENGFEAEEVFEMVYEGTPGFYAWSPGSYAGSPDRRLYHIGFLWGASGGDLTNEDHGG